ncbi:hypothetical protein BT69DRAFT_682377 [Atractiella rhizophila]|nr:hypothetical protein BT69DRAFT_682377 [Atractiella rhizophila]
MSSSVSNDTQLADFVEQVVSAVVAPLMIGSWISTALYGIELLLAHHWYQQRVVKDTAVLKCAIAFVLVVDTVAVIVSQMGVYDYAITHFGEFSYLLGQHWHFIVYELCTALTALVLQTFLLHRYWKLSRNVLISLFLLASTMAAFATSLALAVALVQHATLYLQESLAVYLTLWLGLEAATDILIASALVYDLYGFHRRTTVDETRSILSRLIIMTVETGLLTSLWACIVLVVYLTNRLNTYSAGVAYPLGRGYTLTLLANLLLRNSLRSSGSPSLKVTGTMPRTSGISAVVVQNTTIVEIDQASTFCLILLG